MKILETAAFLTANKQRNGFAPLRAHRKQNSYTWKPLIGMVVLTSLSIGAYVKFEVIVATLGYVHKLWGQ